MMLVKLIYIYNNRTAIINLVIKFILFIHYNLITFYKFLILVQTKNTIQKY